jgi:hypothetical protein
MNSKNPYRQQVVRRSLMWLMHSPLPATILCHAISVNIGDEEIDEESIPSAQEVLRCCSCLVQLSPQNNFQLAHFTVKEFFAKIDTKRSPDLALYRIDIDASTLERASICLTYLNLNEFSKGPIESLNQWLHIQQSYPFLSYSAQSWTRLWRSRWSDNTSRSLVQRLFSTNLSGRCQALIQQLFWPGIHVAITQRVKSDNSISEAFFQLACLIQSWGSLHIAAMLREPQLCSWLLQSSCAITDSCDFGKNSRIKSSSTRSERIRKATGWSFSTYYIQNVWLEYKLLFS